MSNLYEIPQIGQPYQGAGRVTDIQEEVQETPGHQVWTRKIITLDSGMVFTLDHYVQKKGDGDEEERVIATSLSGSTEGMEDSYLLPAEDASNSVPFTIMVYSKNDPDLPPPLSLGGDSSSTSPEPIRGVWTFGDGRSTYEDDQNDKAEEDNPFWKPQEVLLFPPNSSGGSHKRMINTLATIPEDSSLPSGVWGYAEDQQPNGDDSDSRLGSPTSNKLNGDTAEDWHPKGLALVVPPAAQVPENFVAAGRYIYKPDAAHKAWPPPIDHVKKQLHEVGKIQLPKCFQENDGKFPIKVFPKSKLPITPKDDPVAPSTNRWDEGANKQANCDSPPPKPRKKVVTFAPPVGQWVYPEGEEVHDDHFLPVDVDLYWGDEKPAGAAGVMSDDGSMVSWGVWGSSVGSIDLDDPDWEPEMSMVFPPGMEPDPEIAIQGRWAYRMTQNVKIEWPPTVTKTATVFPSKDAPAVERGKSQGVWDFKYKRNEANENDWEPVDVELLGEYESVYDVDEDEEIEPPPFGFWGIKHGAEPDRNFDWWPKDVMFFPPNVEPGENTWVQGKWRLKREDGKPKGTWPPKSKPKQKSRSMGQLEPLLRNSTAWVYPIQSAPPPKQGKTLGTWKFAPGSEPEDSSMWKPQQVDLYRLSDKVDDTKPNGTWGVNADAQGIEGGDTFFAPEDIWFYPPGVTPDENCSIQGKWAFQKSKLDVTWPPLPQSPTRPAKASSVGKLKIPGAFEKEASPRVGGKKVLTGGNIRLPSMFSNT